MMGLSTGRYSVLRGSTTNEYGDEVDGDGVASSGIRGSVIEQTTQVFNPDDGRVATIRSLIGRFPSGSDIQDGDRIMDEKTKEVFVVASLARQNNVLVKSDIVADLTKA
jgi:hypothetical protein